MEEKQNVNYIVLMNDETTGKLSWGRCESMTDVEMFKLLYNDNYPNAEYEVYKVSEKVS